MKVLGFDLGSDPQEFKGMMESVVVNAPVASQRLSLFQSNDDSYDFIGLRSLVKTMHFSARL